jgi:hypothetical protein|tara:strand:- start:243 stop:629 length:387 start_codon:yes stop_codon:yes gene_type:complete
MMAEITPDEKFNYKNKLGWNYIGKNSKGEPKFRRYIDQTLEDVKKYLDAKGLQYLVHEDIACMFIYKDKEPESRYSSRYVYYYTTGRWGSDKRRKHYYSDGIKHFIEKFYMTTEQTKEYWNKKEMTDG